MTEAMSNGWRLNRSFRSQLDADSKLEWTQACLDRRIVPAKKGDDVGKTKVGKDSLVH